LPAIRVRSDIERKRLLGLDETANSDSKPGAGIYTDHARGDVYAKLVEIAEGLLEAGFNAIIDASFLRQADRKLPAALAGRQGVFFAFVSTSADEAELLRRLQEREKSGKDASEADADVLQYQFRNSEPFNAAERKKTVFVGTEKKVDAGRIIKSLKKKVR